jgi:hypothetical protein
MKKVVGLYRNGCHCQTVSEHAQPAGRAHTSSCPQPIRMRDTHTVTELY